VSVRQRQEIQELLRPRGLITKSFAERGRDKPRLALNNITAGVREREDADRTGVAGHLDEIQGSVANTMKLLSQGASPLSLPAVAGETFRSWLH
jgi:hypothetical protein